MDDRMDLIGAEILAEVPLELDISGEDASVEEAQALVARQVEEAFRWREQYLDPLQEEATNYYMGRPFGDEMEGRSQVVSTDVRDAVQAIMPSLLRVFCGPERVVEFKPEKPEDVPVAQQMTDYVNYLFMEENEGFLTLFSTMKDAMVRKLGVVKWWWDESDKVTGSQHSGLTEEELTALEMDDSVVEIEAEQTSEPEYLTDPSTGEPVVDPQTGAPVMQTPAYFDVSVSRREVYGCPKVATVPPEEFVFSPNARSLADAKMVGHVRYLTASELKELGVPDDMIETAKSKNRESRNETMSGARRLDYLNRASAFEDEGDESTESVRFADLYVRMDFDDDGIAELRHICAVGDDCQFFVNEVVDEVPFALFGPDPEPHTLVGLSVADYVMDLQRIKSAIMRGMLDSLSLSLNPSTEVVDGEVNLKDLQNNEVGRIVRVTRPGMMREVSTPFVGGAALPVLEFMDTVKENRVGISRAAAGLDADALQSSTKAAVAATLSASQQRMEMIARIFAETGMKQLFRGILRMVVRHQDKAKVVRLRNEWVAVDPAHWNADMDVVVNVALGAGLVEEKMQTLMLILGEQKENIMQGSPLAGFPEYRNTLGRLVELSGYRNSDEFFKPFGEEQMAAYAQQQAQQAEQAPPDPTEAFVQVEMAKVEQKMAEFQAEMAFKQEEMQMLHQRETEKIIRDFLIKQAHVQVQGQQAVTQADIQRERNAIQAEQVENTAVLGLVDRAQKAAQMTSNQQAPSDG